MKRRFEAVTRRNTLCVVHTSEKSQLTLQTVRVTAILNENRCVFWNSFQSAVYYFERPACAFFSSFSWRNLSSTDLNRPRSFWSHKDVGENVRWCHHCDGNVQRGVMSKASSWGVLRVFISGMCHLLPRLDTKPINSWSSARKWRAPPEQTIYVTDLFGDEASPLQNILAQSDQIRLLGLCSVGICMYTHIHT